MSTDKLYLGQPANSNTSWGDAMRNALDSIEEAICPDDVFFVSPHFTDTYLHDITSAANRRHFDTIQGAIDAVPPSTQSLIRIHPGEYEEHLAIDGDQWVHLAGVAPLAQAHCGPQAQIRGTTGSSSPIITLTVGASEYGNLVLSNLFLDNQFNTGGGSWSTVNDAMILKVAKTGAYASTKTRIALDRCIVRGQTWGGDVWDALVWLDNVGKSELFMKDCEIMSGTYDPGHGHAGQVYNLVKIEGDRTAQASADYSAILAAKRCAFTHGGESTPASGSVHVSDEAFVYAAHCDFNRPFSNSEAWCLGALAHGNDAEYYMESIYNLMHAKENQNAFKALSFAG